MTVSTNNILHCKKQNLIELTVSTSTCTEDFHFSWICCTFPIIIPCNTSCKTFFIVTRIHIQIGI